MKNAQIRNFLDKEIEIHTTPRYEVMGFHFILDDPSKFNPYTWESANACGFYREEGMPRCEGFFYCGDDYQAYLNVLRESGSKHPANVDNLEWVLRSDDELRVIGE